MVITISRIYGAGGHSVAEALSKRLGLEYYDKDFVKLTAQASGYSEEQVLKSGENMSSGARWMNDFLDNMSSYTSAYDRIFEVQRDVLMDLAKKDCIIVGRCANIILRNAGVETFDVFLFANREHQLKRTKELNEYGNMDPEKYMDRRNHLRQVYYKAYTGHEMGDYRDYNLCIDTGVTGIEKTADIIAQILGK